MDRYSTRFTETYKGYARMNIYKSTLIALLLLPTGMLSLNAREVLWGDFVALEIPVGQEYTVFIEPPLNIELGIPESLSSKLSVLNTPGRIFINPKEPFNANKIAIKHPQKGVVLINLSARQDIAQSSSLTIATFSGKSDKNHYKRETTQKLISECELNYIDLSRWLMQKLYAPARLIKKNECFSRIAVDTSKIDLFACYRNLLCGGGSEANVLGGWKSIKGTWLYAIEIKNMTSNEVILDYRDIKYQSAYLAVVFAHIWLDKSGTAEDTTVAVLITNNPLTSQIPRLVGNGIEARQ